MAEETREEEFESLLSEEDEQPDTELDADGDEGSEQGEEDPEGAPSLKGQIGRFLHRRRRLLCSACGVILLAALTATMTRYGFLKITFSPASTLLQEAEQRTDDPSGAKGVKMQGGRLEYLSFFIPLPSGSGNRVARVNCSVAWDRLASLHYQRREVQVRKDLYLYLIKVAERRKVFELKSSLLEAGMGRIIKESLGLRDLKVRLEGIKAF
ncbi:MAG: hypothetical protein JW821_07045 [Deltaproteobacteria bacterium]|nr:hypothetical protein [Deltaproteobacteria bacterium]